MSEPWERQDGETSRAFAAFAVYRDLGTHRTLKAAAQRFYDPCTRAREQQVEAWSRRNGWVERVQAWDDRRDQVGTQAQLDEIVEMNRRHSVAARALQQRALTRLQALDPTLLTPYELMRMLKWGIEIERTAMGEVNERVEVTSPEQRRQAVFDRVQALRQRIADDKAGVDAVEAYANGGG